MKDTTKEAVKTGAMLVAVTTATLICVEAITGGAKWAASKITAGIKNRKKKSDKTTSEET